MRQPARLFPLLIMLVAFGCATVGTQPDPLPIPPAAPVFDRLIVPGQRIGPASLGMSGQQLLAALGAPTQSINTPWGTSTVFANGISAMVRESDYRVSSLTVSRDHGFRTAEGLGIGTTEFEIRSRLGPPASAASGDLRNLCYPGLTFTLDPRSGRTTHVGVMAQVPRDCGGGGRSR